MKNNMVISDKELIDFKEYKHQYYINNKDKILKECKIYREEHKEEKKEYNRLYYLKNKEQIKSKTNNYYQNNKKAHHENVKQWRNKNRDRVNEKSREWGMNNPEKIKLKNAKRKKFGFNSINKYFFDAHGHHLHINNHDEILYIPSKLHMSIKHAYNNPKTMQKINDTALEWYFENNVQFNIGRN